MMSAPNQSYDPVEVEAVERVRRQGSGIRGLATWRPNEAGVGVYRPGWVGVTSHLDGRWYRRLVVVVTLVGSARFEIRRSREGPVIEAWDARARAITLMRAPGLAGVRDGRPFHAVHGPRRGVRCSVALRMARPAPDGNCFARSAISRFAKSSRMRRRRSLITPLFWFSMNFHNWEETITRLAEEDRCSFKICGSGSHVTAKLYKNSACLRQGAQGLFVAAQLGIGNSFIDHGQRFYLM